MVRWLEEVVMVKFRFGKRVTPSQPASVDERLAEATPAPATAEPPADAGTSDAAARPGVSDAVGDRLAAPDLANAAERLGAAVGATTGSGDGSSDGGESGSSGSTIGSIEEARAGLAAGDPTGLTAAADQLAARRPEADLPAVTRERIPRSAAAPMARATSEVSPMPASPTSTVHPPSPSADEFSSRRRASRSGARPSNFRLSTPVNRSAGAGKLKGPPQERS